MRKIAELGSSDRHAKATIQHLIHHFSKAISLIINIIDPDAIVIGGGVGNIDALYSKHTRRLIEKHVFCPAFNTPILRPKLGDSAGVFGAAMLFNDPSSQEVPTHGAERYAIPGK